jgi:5-methylcytosine-specific restriction endonuclease McrA
MSRKILTTEQFIEDMLCGEVHSNGIYNYKLVDYTGALKKIEIFCNICQKSFWQRPNHHKQGHGCPFCNAKDISQRYTHSTDQFIEDILCAETHPDGKYNYRLIEYISNRDRIEIICNTCQKSFWQVSSSHKDGIGCPYCFGNTKLNIEQIKQKLTIEEEPIEVNSEIQCRCTHCKQYFTPTRQQLHSRIYSLSGRYKGECRLYCSDKCKDLCPIYGQKTHYKDNNITKPDTSRPDQPELKQNVLKRDNFECQRCGSSEDLHCHHITGVEINPIESADIDNCITLCYTCHQKVHSSGHCDVRRRPCIVS